MAMIMAIAVILIVSGIMALSLSMTAATNKRTVDLYIYEQAVLLSKSATEYALLQISQNPPCSDLDVNFMHDTIYNVDIRMGYVYYDDSATVGVGNNEAQNLCALNGGRFYASVETEEQDGSVIMDVRIRVDNASVSNEPITFFRRTVQKL